MNNKLKLRSFLYGWGVLASEWSREIKLSSRSIIYFEYGHGLGFVHAFADFAEGKRERENERNVEDVRQFSLARPEVSTTHTAKAQTNSSD